MRPIDRIHALLDTASIIADEQAMDTGEASANDPFTFLAQQIDNALARAAQIAGLEPPAPPLEEVHTKRLDEARQHMIDYLMNLAMAEDPRWYIVEHFTNLNDVDLAQEFRDQGGEDS